MRAWMASSAGSPLVYFLPGKGRNRRLNRDSPMYINENGTAQKMERQPDLVPCVGPRRGQRPWTAASYGTSRCGSAVLDSIQISERIKRANVKTQAVMHVRKQRGSEDFWLATEGGKQHYYIGLGCASATRLAGEHGKIPWDGLRWPRVG